MEQGNMIISLALSPHVEAIGRRHIFAKSLKMFRIRLLLCISFLVRTATCMFYYPNPQISLLEHMLVDNWKAYSSNLSTGITPCTNYVTEVGEPALNSGRTSAAQWIRVAFHDFVTGNVAAGTGGVDASIGFETFREENKGSAFNDSFTFWRPFVNEFVSSTKTQFTPLSRNM